MQKILSNLYSLPKTYFGSAPAPEAPAPEPPAAPGVASAARPAPVRWWRRRGRGGAGHIRAERSGAAGRHAGHDQRRHQRSALDAAGQPDGAGQSLQQLIQDSIQKLLTRGFTPVSENDPEIRAQFQPTANVLERGARRSREEQAETAGLSRARTSAARAGRSMASSSRFANRRRSQEGQLMAAAHWQANSQARRQDVTNALGFAQGEDRIRLQAQQTQIDAELRRLALALQEKGIDAGGHAREPGARHSGAARASRPRHSGAQSDQQPEQPVLRSPRA